MKPDYPTAIWRPAASANFGSRPAGIPIDCVVLHATVGSLSATLAWFSNPTSGVSAHYVVTKSGVVYQMVEESMRAQHAGASSYQGRTDFNDFSIGIEMINKNDGLDPYPREQLEATVNLTSYLVAKYDLAREWIVTHADISNVGKTDPLGFPIHELLAQVYDPTANPPDAVVREAAWNEAGIPYNPEAAFAKYARAHDLGNPQTEEFDFSYEGTDYRGQGFGRAIVFCKVGDWENLKETSW
jgi:N-acetyl-anhydromuramyl-L-alanine amidase AmpD